MSKRKMNASESKDGERRKSRAGVSAGIAGLLDDLRQSGYPPAWRISLQPERVSSGAPMAPTDSLRQPAGLDPAAPRSEVSPVALAEVASCLWYLKTRHFRREWQNADTADDDPRTRRTLGRLNKGVDALRKCGVEVEDPVGKRYAAGSEAMMKPLDFSQVEGLTYEKVVETVAPLVYWNGRIVQRAEVFVAVPPAAPAVAAVAPRLAAGVRETQPEGEAAEGEAVLDGAAAESARHPTVLETDMPSEEDHKTSNAQKSGGEQV